MELFNLKLIEIILRYAHIFAVILWIGNSYFFTYVDNKIQKNITDKGIDAEGILQHSGIFYRLSRFKGVPDQFEKLEKNLVIFKWQATTAFVTGIFLLIIIYYKNAQFLIIDPRVNSNVTPMIGIIASIVSIGVSWFFYHLITKSKLKNNKVIYVTILFLFSVVVTYILAQIFSQRFLFFSVGVTLGVIMWCNVWYVIIPNQKKMVSATLNKTDFDLNLSEYIFEDLGLAPEAAAITTPLVSPVAITPGSAAANTQNVLPTGLTRTETALLSPEEQAIRLRSRGLA